MADPNNRSSRSNSLQCMLELEKRYNFDRLHSSSAPSNPTSHPWSAKFTKPSSTTRPGILARRTEASAQKIRRKSNAPLRDLSLPPQPPPLVINTGSPMTMRRSDLFMSQSQEYSPTEQDSTIVSTPRDKYRKVVSFEFPPTESAPAPCHSPSWEAYEKRKTEKRTERKERDESRNGRAKKLVKPPPASSPNSMQHTSAPEVDASRGRQRDRQDSSTAVNNASNPPRKARSRSGSFVSLLRAPFEFRRSSVDHGTNSSFIGGIKLEMQQNAAAQQALDDQAVEHDESNIHPALRKGKGRQSDRWSAPLRSPPPPPRASAYGENHRRYPPITRSKYHHKTMSLVSPTAPAVPDLNTIDKWRAKVGLKPGSRPGSRMSLDADATLEGTGAAVGDFKLKISEPTDIRLSDSAMSASASPAKPTDVVFPASPPGEAILGNKPRLDYSNNVSISSCSTGDTFDTAPSSPPPEPPRRSSKRNSALIMDGSVPPLPSPKHSLQDTTPPQRSFPLCEGLHRKETAKDRPVGAPVRTSQPATYMSSPASHLPGSSSEDSGSEDFLSTSIVSTPATSRPQSERGIPLDAAKDGHLEPERDKDKPLLEVQNTTYPPPHDMEDTETEIDCIQAVAEKVLHAYTKIPVQAPGLRRRSNSQSTLTKDTSNPPPLEHSPLELRQKRDKPGPPSSASAASFATYLEEARQPPPTAPPQRAHKRRLGPPASFALPDCDSDAAATANTQSSVPDIVGRSLRHKSTPLLSMSDREPVAKVFVECCNCKYYHDMPSNLYEAMANPESVLSHVDKLGYAGALATAVKCSWCRHEMSTRCCAGLAATVYIKERLH
ncbi:uncharacterized protein MAM_07477 [Metarhizium album ARSEF 1941]|uniref:Uncharacterized protein n=1 Tax=Metarhizium album (strain ARSEF 1941) TaxID=1081103 RepID=A0A0B2WMK7_METAS|nr:uncharacterized protein MAM_07477 [Metarhizium album ARSEF 1941]KHN94722.1 hypothetical protein MAM_07477 [Metarhizium album ARSEF 1941]